MSNLALNKLPLEKDNWRRPEDATNGITAQYDGEEGYAFADWPCTYTLDLGMEYRLSVIRFLLWDNLGKQGNKIQLRKYKFTLSLSPDGKNFTTVFSNQSQEGSNGWFSFRFANDTYAQYVRLTGHDNNINKQFQIVEFEIHDQDTPALISSNVHDYIVTSMGMLSEERLIELINKVTSEKSVIFGGLEEKRRLLDISLKEASQAFERFNKAFEKIELIEQSHHFMAEAKENEKRAEGWLLATAFPLALFIGLLVYFWFFDKHSTEIITSASTDKAVQPYTTLLLSSYYVIKALSLSILLFILGWLLKNYRSEKHNYVINQHKAMALTVATAISTKENYKNAFIQAMEIILTHQSSGFSHDDNTSPSIVNTILQRGLPKID